MSNAPFEPSADTRAVAKQLKNLFEALVAEGFTERQALTIVGQCIAAGGKQGEAGP